ncbi:MAG: HNH endonuclease [Caryophanon sp.]|nr:HNH endonuclease [Caryophanon sp.]
MHRDHHRCQNPTCSNKDKQPILALHHIVYRKNGGTDTPNNLITLCTKCHTPKNHKGFLLTWRPTMKPLKGATFMSSVRWRLTDMLEAEHTYGYQTKSARIAEKMDIPHELFPQKSRPPSSNSCSKMCMKKRSTFDKIKSPQQNHQKELLYV